MSEMPNSDIPESRISTPQIPVGYYIAEEMHARSWTLETMAYCAHIPVNELIDILVGERTMTEQHAVGFAKAFGTSVIVWQRLGDTTIADTMRDRASAGTGEGE